MDYFDLINELCKGEPNIRKAERAVKTLGWICIFGAVWNFIMPLIVSFEGNPFLPESFPLVAFISLLIVGVLFLISSRGIGQKAKWGVLTAQISIVLVLGLIAAFAVVFIFSSKDFLPKEPAFRVIAAIIFTLVFGQFFILGFFGMQYLERLPVEELVISNIRFGIDKEAGDEVSEVKSSIPWEEQTYKDALFPFGIGGTFALLVTGLLITVFAVDRYLGESMMSAVFLSGFVLVLFGPLVYNRLPSPFERNRELIASYTGGGSIALFTGSWPFFKLIVYKDGLEVRVMFHRFF